MEFAENIVQLLATLVALLMCLFQYISNKHRSWLYAITFFLCTLLSCYYWAAYVVIMGSDPNVSDFFTYTGWNASYMVLFIFLMHRKTSEERRYFHPLMLLPVPLNAAQLIIYLPYGRLVNNVYQVGICTLIACFSIQSLCWYRKSRDGSTPKPLVPLAVLLITVCEFGMWTSSCLYEPFASLYYPFSFLLSLTYLFLPWSLARTYSAEGRTASTTFDRKYQNVLKVSYLTIVLVFSTGGVLLGIWMRNVMMAHLGPSAESDVFDIIPVVLFVISLILVVAAIAVIVVVYFGQRAAENNQLREATRIAERSNAAKSEFLANMSHEIRTPINAVMGMNEIVLRESLQARDHLPADSEAVRGIFGDICGYSGIIDTAGKNLLAIINDILDISKIEAGKMEIREEPYLLSSLLNDVCDLIGFRAQSKDLAFRVDVDPRLPDHLCGDVLRVRQVILNLLNNAVKYTEQGSVTLSVSGDPVPVAESGQVINLSFSVRDTGIGIRRQDLSRLFEKFERIGPAEGGDVEGTGLGLTIAKNLLDMMGGTIRVESIYGEGSDFTVTLPQKAASAEPVGDLRESISSAGNRRVARELFMAPSARILVVDDTRMNLTVTEGLLKNTEMRIDTALGGAEALKLTGAVPYDLILMDQRMPVMDGTEAMRRIRAQEDGVNARTPVICLTADAIAGAKERYLAEGFTDYLSKPIDSLALKKALIRYLPPEKVILTPEQDGRGSPSGPEDNPLSGEAFDALGAEGIDAAQGLSFCQQDEALYRSLLSEFVSGTDEKLLHLERCYESGAWKDYAILVHALKSVSATIGASRLSEAAANMEAAANSEDLWTLRAGHPQLVSLCHRTADSVRAFCRDGDLFPPENDGVMEFTPES